ncbi:hypothetical protein FRB90_007491 [Tulasnella sp. 427]|nr:hypothetical protein FRB90_007491 [Tulasnella sp. 427]
MDKAQERATERPIGVIQSNDDLRCSNANRPIHRLPFELLQCIFQHVLQSCELVEENDSNLFALLQVCTYWRFIIEHSSQLWSRLSAFQPRAYVLKALGKGWGLLDISCKACSCEGVPGPKSDTLHFLETARRVADRWRCLALEFDKFEKAPPAAIKSIQHLLELPAPNLEALDLQDKDARLEIPEVELFGGMSPKLKDVRIVRTRCRWSQAAFKGLSSLHLGTLEFERMEIVLDILRDCPQLQHLTLWRCKFVNNDSGYILPVSLPNLGELRLKFDTPRMHMAPILKEFLDHLSPPLHCALYPCLADSIDTLEIIETAFQYWLFGRQMPNTLDKLDNVELRFGPSKVGPSTFQFVLSSGATRISGGFETLAGNSVFRTLKYLAPHIKRSHSLGYLKTFKIRCAAAGVDLVGNIWFAPELSRLPPITHLEIEDYEKPIERDLIDQALRGTHRHIGSAFFPIRHLIFRNMPFDVMSRHIQAALNHLKPAISTGSEACTRTLDSVEIRVKEKNFPAAMTLLETLRDEQRIERTELFVVIL